MAGKRQKSFRGGDLSEELGLLLLKGFAAVATVPRTEDIGIDAIATLLSPSSDNMLIAEDSFYVQFKSASQRNVKYKDHEVRWLEKLKLPYFLGRVDKSNSSIELYATHKLSQVLLEKQYHEVILLFSNRKEQINDTIRSAYIGPPLLKWTVRDLSVSSFAYDAYSVLKPYLIAEQRNIDYRNIRYLESIQWESGKPPNCTQIPMIHHSIEMNDILPVFQQMHPYLLAIALHSSMAQDKQARDALQQLMNYMRRHGFDPDPHCMIEGTSLYMWDLVNRLEAEENEII